MLPAIVWCAWLVTAHAAPPNASEPDAVEPAPDGVPPATEDPSPDPAADDEEEDEPPWAFPDPNAPLVPGPGEVSLGSEGGDIDAAPPQNTVPSPDHPIPERSPWGPEAAGPDAPRGTTEALTDKRAMPNVDGLGHTTKRGTYKMRGEEALWVARTPLLPLWAVWRWVLQPPIEGIAEWQERNHVPAKIANAFKVGEDGVLGAAPTALIDFGFRPSVGVYIWAKGLPARDVRMRVRLATGGDRWWLASYNVSIPFDAGARKSDEIWSGTQLNGAVEYTQRPDLIYAGLDASNLQVTRYFRERISGSLATSLVWSHLDGVNLNWGIHRDTFGSSGRVRGEDPSIETVYMADTLGGQGQGAAPPGLEGYTLSYADVRVHLDSRRTREDGGSGFFLDLGSRFGGAVQGEAAPFARWSGTAAALWDVNGNNQILGLTAYASGIEALGEGLIPFEEYATFDSSDRMPAFRFGTLRGGSAASLAAHYSWPVLFLLDATLSAELGSTYSERFANFDLDQLRGSFALGLRSSLGRQSNFQVLLAAGTRTIDNGFGVDSVRVTIGVTTTP